MKRGTVAVTSLAIVCLLAASCAPLAAKARARDTATPGFDPRTAIAVSILGDSIALIDPVTGAMQTVARNLTDFQSGYAVWSPDHRSLAWGNGGITILDTRTGRTRQLNQGQLLSMPAWSPDGRRIAFGDGTQLWVEAVTGGRRTAVGVPQTIAPLAVAWGPATLLAFDGLQLDCVDGASCVSTDQSEIWTVRTDGRGLRQVTHLGHAEGPKWSPDGTRILFVRRFLGSKTPRSELWVVGSEGAGARRLASARDVVAGAWSPDGRQIALLRDGALPNTVQLWIQSADGPGAHPVGDPVPGTDATLDW
jgi:Tol biopolymer transport system component